MSDVNKFQWDIDNMHNVFFTEGQSVDIDENIDENGHQTFGVEFTFDTGVLTIKQTSHDENLDHVFLIKFFQDGEVTCMFWGLLEMETPDFRKRFTVISQEFSTEEGINALRQILPEDRICLSANDADYVEDGEEAIDPVRNLGDRFADVANNPSDDDASDDDASDDEELEQV